MSAQNIILSGPVMNLRGPIDYKKVFSFFNFAVCRVPISQTPKAPEKIWPGMLLKKNSAFFETAKLRV